MRVEFSEPFHETSTNSIAEMQCHVLESRRCDPRSPRNQPQLPIMTCQMENR